MKGKFFKKIHNISSLILLISLFVFISCLSNVNIKDHIEYSNKINNNRQGLSYKKIRYSKYTPMLDLIICCEDVIEGIRTDFLHLYSNSLKMNQIIFNPLNLEYIKKINDLSYVSILETNVIDDEYIIIEIDIGSKELMKTGDDYRRVILNYSTMIIKDDSPILWEERVGKQSLDNRHIFYIQEKDTYFIQSINEKEPNDKQLLNKSGFVTDICDGINEETVFYSTIDEKNTKDIWDDRNVFVLYNWKKNKIIKEINLPDYFHKYLKGNSLNINLSKDKKYLLFGFFPYGYWVCNLENNKIYEICNTKYNWNWGFGKIKVTFCDWSWEKNKILFNIVSNKERDVDSNGLYEIDLDRIDELNLRIIK